MKQFADHVLSYSPELVKEKVVNIFPGDGLFTILTGKSTYEAKAVILATGVVATGLFEGEKDLLWQRGQLLRHFAMACSIATRM